MSSSSLDCEPLASCVSSLFLISISILPPDSQVQDLNHALSCTILSQLQITPNTSVFCLLPPNLSYLIHPSLSAFLDHCRQHATMFTTLTEKIFWIPQPFHLPSHFSAFLQARVIALSTLTVTTFFPTSY